MKVQNDVAVSTAERPSHESDTLQTNSTTSRADRIADYLRDAAAAVLLPLAAIVGIFVIWEIAVREFEIAPYLLPLPTDVVAVLLDEWSRQLAGGTLVTFLESLYGFILAVIVSVPLAVAITYSRVFSQTVYPLMVIAQVVPKVAIAPVLVIWLGFGMTPKVLVSFLISFFGIVISLVVGLRSVNPGMIDLGRTMGASPLQLFLKIRMPHALPIFFGGLKVGITFAVVGAVVGEFVGSGTGLGHIVLLAMGSMDLPLVYACVVLMSAIGVVMFIAVEIAERLIVPWANPSGPEALARG